MTCPIAADHLPVFETRASKPPKPSITAQIVGPTSFRAQQHLLPAGFDNRQGLLIPGLRADPKKNQQLALGIWPGLGFVHLRDDDGDLELPFFENPGP